MRTLANMVDRLGGEYDFHILTRDHDGGSDRTPYPNVKINEWNTVGNASVKYLSRDSISLREIRSAIVSVAPRAIYLNSYFSQLTVYFLLLRRLGFAKNIPVIIAPEGELAPTARQIKRKKKAIYLRAAAACRLYDDIDWKVASDTEAKDTERSKGRGGSILLAPNMPPKVIFPEYQQTRKPLKIPGQINLTYLSRIHPIKNLHFLLELLANLDRSKTVRLKIYGPVDDVEYFERCNHIAAGLPDNIMVSFDGEVENQHVCSTLFDSDFFILPTLGENFGHVILDALAAGCPLIVSDRTPWKKLAENGIGWDLPLEHPKQWILAIERGIEMNNAEYTVLSTNARSFVEEWLKNDELEDASRKVFEHALKIGG